MSLVSEFLQKVGLIRNETQYHGNTKERVADTFETLFNLDVWFKKLDPQDPDANKIYQADGTLVDLPIPAPKQIQQIPTYNDLPVPGEEGIVYYIIDEDEDYAWSDNLNDYYDYVEPKGFLDDRASNLVDDLTEQEKAVIKAKLGIEVSTKKKFLHLNQTTDISLSAIKAIITDGEPDTDNDIFDDWHIHLNIGTNNINIDVDVDGWYNVTMRRTGTGSVNFTGANIASGSDMVIGGLNRSLALIMGETTTKRISVNIV